MSGKHRFEQLVWKEMAGIDGHMLQKTFEDSACCLACFGINSVDD